MAQRRYRQHVTAEEQAALTRVLGRILTPEQRAGLRQSFREYVGAVSLTELPPQKPKKTRARTRKAGNTTREKR